MLFMGIGMLLFWGGLIVLPALLIGGMLQSRNKHAANQAAENLTPKQILEQRYARGEITREQYQVILKDIQ